MSPAARRVRRLARDERGATAVEFALIAIPLLLFMFGSIEFGRMLWTRQSMSQAVAIGARCLGVPQSECSSSGVRDAAKAKTFVVATAAKWGLKVTAAQVTVNAAATCAGATGFSQVTMTRTFATAVPALIKQLAGNPMTVSACFPNSAAS